MQGIIAPDQDVWCGVFLGFHMFPFGCPRTVTYTGDLYQGTEVSSALLTSGIIFLLEIINKEVNE